MGCLEERNLEFDGGRFSCLGLVGNRGDGVIDGGVFWFGRGVGRIEVWRGRNGTVSSGTLWCGRVD